MSTPLNIQPTNTQSVTHSGRVVLIGGGVRSGKSAFALERARSLGQRRAFIATAEAFDDEMRVRIGRHVEERRDEFETFEAPRDLDRSRQRSQRRRRRDRLSDPLAVESALTWRWRTTDCGTGRDALARAARLSASCRDRDERGRHGHRAQSKLGRVFRDVTGRAHQRLAVVADEIYFAVLGTMLRLRPEPITTSLR